MISVALYLAVNLSSPGLRQLFAFDCETDHSKNGGRSSEVLTVYIQPPTHHLSDLYFGELCIPYINAMCSKFLEDCQESGNVLEATEV